MSGLKRRFSQRPDGEHKHAFVRLLLAGALLLAAAAGVFDTQITPAWAAASNIALAYLLAAALILVAIALRPSASQPRRLFSLCLDLAVTSALLATGGEAAVVLAPVYLWIVLGNGVSYGPVYLLGAGLGGLAGFGAGAAFSVYLSDQPMASIALALTLIVAPMYLFHLLRSFAAAEHRAAAAARAGMQMPRELRERLRMPLNGVVGMSELLLLQSRISSEQQALGEAICLSAQRLQAILDDRPALAQAERPTAASTCAEFDLRRLIDDTLSVYQRAGRKAGQQFSVHIASATPYLLRGETLYLRQLLVHLIGKIYKTKAAGQVAVRVAPLLVEPRHTRLRIEIEVDTPAQPTAADAHAPIDTLSQELVDRLGGSIDTGRSADDPVRISMELPFARQDVPMSNPSAQMLPGARVLSLLRTQTAATVSSVLRGWAVPCDHAEDKAELMARLRSAGEQNQSYAAILIDHGRLDSDPGEIAAELRDDPLLASSSLILLSDAGAVNVAACLQAGYSSVLRIPIDKTLLFNALHAAQDGHQGAANVVSLARRYHARSNGNALRILLAESDYAQRQDLFEQLRSNGHSVIAVADAEAALNLLSADSKQFDLALLAARLPDRDGAEIVKTLRFMEYDDHRVATILLSAQAESVAEQQCASSGADAVLTKPVEVRRLVETVAYVMQTASVPARARATTRAKPASSPTLILNESKLENLARLGSGADFVRELIDGFQRDGERLLTDLETAVVEQDYRRYRDCLHAIRGSSMELGCQFLAAECQTAGQLKPFHIGETVAREMSERIKLAYSRTCQVLEDYMQRRREVR